MSDTQSVTVYSHSPALGKVDRHPSGTVAVDVSEYPVQVTLFFDGATATEKFAWELLRKLRNLNTVETAVSA